MYLESGGRALHYWKRQTRAPDARNTMLPRAENVGTILDRIVRIVDKTDWLAMLMWTQRATLNNGLGLWC